MKRGRCPRNIGGLASGLTLTLFQGMIFTAEAAGGTNSPNIVLAGANTS
ncbi:hypothetical protein BDFG_08688 [Blastomyces dermatitidis ATCC 26199]|nr:hypothetical protein BDFG_08688 [Blastomyces dermatitidis ATCC 26199]